MTPLSTSRRQNWTPTPSSSSSTGENSTNSLSPATGLAEKSCSIFAGWEVCTTQAGQSNMRMNYKLLGAPQADSEKKSTAPPPPPREKLFQFHKGNNVYVHNQICVSCKVPISGWRGGSSGSSGSSEGGGASEIGRTLWPRTGWGPPVRHIRTIRSSAQKERSDEDLLIQNGQKSTRFFTKVRSGLNYSPMIKTRFSTKVRE